MRKAVPTPLKAAALLLLSCLTGCASITTGTTQPMAVETRLVSGQDIIGAHCRLTNSKGTWFVTTPGTVTIHRASIAPLAIECSKDGHEQLGVSSTKPKSKGMTWGNLLFGGVIGVITDGVTGAAGYYPSPITVIMQTLASVSTPAETRQASEPMPTSSAPAVSPSATTTPPAGNAPASNWRNWGNQKK